MLTIQNDGGLIVETNYFSTEHARAGMLHLSTNAGCVRLLVPDSLRAAIEEIRGAEHIVVSTLPVSDHRPQQFAVEWMAEDGTDEPWACHLSPGQLSTVPSATDWTGNWTAAVYVSGAEGKPERAMKFPCHIRQVCKLPCLLPFADTIKAHSKGVQ